MTYASTIAGCCRELLDTSADAAGRVVPLSLTDLTSHAVAAGRTTARYPEQAVRNALQHEAGILALDDSRFVSVPRLLVGRVLTTRTGRGCTLHGANLGYDEPTSTSSRTVDLGALLLLGEPVAVRESAFDETAALAYRVVDGEISRELIARTDLADGSALVAAVRTLREQGSRWRREAAREVLLACLADDGLLREPVAPLSELMPELVPEPAAPRRPMFPVQRTCRSCEGSGIERDYGSGYLSDDRYDDTRSGIPEHWRERIERLEEVTYGPA